MPLIRVSAEGVGPFEKLELDLSDGNGNPHLGPHIICGVNGSGKSTVLRAIASVMDPGLRGFPINEWAHSISDARGSWVAALLDANGEQRGLAAAALGTAELRSHKLPEWLPPLGSASRRDLPWVHWWTWQQRDHDAAGCISAYAPNRTLRQIDRLTQSAELDDRKGALSFQETVNNEAIHQWWKDAVHKANHAKLQGSAPSRPGLILDDFRRALQLLVGPGCEPEISIDTPSIQPRLRWRNQILNLSQLPDGVRNTVGWIADFLMRWEVYRWRTKAEGPPFGILLLDEIDAHLHPQWQRRILPAMKEALPNVQIIVTTHSPFVISSCPGARVHVLELNGEDVAIVRPPIDAPFGETLTSTIKDIFDVPTEFDRTTEADLNRWNDLVKREAAGRIDEAGETELIALSEQLASRSEELKALVGPYLRAHHEQAEPALSVKGKSRKL